MKVKQVRTIIELAQQAFGKYKKQIFMIAGLGFLCGLLEGIGINALIPLFSFVTGSNESGNDFISQVIKRSFEILRIDFRLKYLLVFIALLFIIKTIVLIFANYLKVRITADYEREMRNYLFSRTLKAKWRYLLKEKLGKLETVLMTDVNRGASMLEQLAEAIMVFTTLAVYAFVAINISIPITLITLLMGIILFFVFKPLMSGTRRASKETSSVYRSVAHFANENILGLKTIKSMAIEFAVAQTGKKYFGRLRDLILEVFLYRNITISVMQPISVIFILFVFAFSYKSANFNFAALAAIVYLIQRIFSYIQEFQSGMHKVSAAVPFLQNVLKHEKEIAEYQEKNIGMDNFRFNNLLEFKDVKFSYKKEKDVLAGVNFSISRGEMVGLIGPSGAGKTTIVDLVLRLFNPTSGEILLDGKNIRKIKLKDWRKNIGYVSQDIFLINDTIANNIKFYDDSISDKEIEEAAKSANIYDFIQNCPEKFETNIGERGIMLSVGQRQRIIIARVLARQPKFLLLDEATSALDNESELKIKESIDGLKGKVPVFIIAHRLSTVMNCDKVLAIENGKIIEQGEPKKLLNDKKSYFYQIYYAS
jgi:ABC-type multidrug transport system fused ATPase/permease subunit